MNFELNERKIKILEAIVNDYIATAEPIGSRTIAKKYNWGISSATIRNEMSDLEELGLISQPHASSGRIPSDKGYRLYVDRLMRRRELTAQEVSFLHNLILSNINQIDYLMQETARALSLLTNYTAIISEPNVKKTKIKRIQLVPLDDNSVVLMLITDSKAIKNLIVSIPNAPNGDELNKYTAAINSRLIGTPIGEINDVAVESLLNDYGMDRRVLLPVMDAIIDSASADEDVTIYTSGVKNILGFPEFSNVEKAKAVFQALEEKKLLITLLNGEKTDDITIVIGTENTLVQLRDCSIVKANYMLDGSTYGSIGVIGPTRMDYEQTASMLNGIINIINKTLKALTGG